MFLHLSDHTAALTAYVRIDYGHAFLRRYTHTPIRSHAGMVGISPWPAHQFTTAIWTNVIHLVAALWAEGAFEGADVSFSVGRKFCRTFFTGSFHFQRHGC